MRMMLRVTIPLLFLLFSFSPAWAADGDPCTSSFGTVSAAGPDTDKELCGNPAAYTTTTTTATTNCAAGAISSGTITLTSAANFDTTGGSAAICNASGVCNNFTYTSIAATTMNGIANDANGGLTTCTGNYASGSRIYAMTTATNLARRLRILMTAIQSAQKYVGEVNTTCAGKTAQGQVCWNTTAKLLSIGDGAALSVLAVGDASGNATGVACSACITLTTEVTGVLPLANGGTNANLTASNGGIAYSTATAFALSAVGVSGQALISGGAGAPTWFAPTAGQIWYGGAGGIIASEASFFWDSANKRLGVGTNAPGAGMQTISDASLDETKPGLRITDTTAPVTLLVTARNADAYVGTNTNHPMSLFTNALERVTITADGRVGIGNTSPNSMLDVSATTPGGISNPITLNNASTTAGTEVFLEFAPTTSPTIRFAGISATNDGSNNIPLIFYTGTGASITEKMRISSAGIVSIGTSFITGATGPGDIVIPNLRSYRALNQAGSTTIGLLSLNTGNNIRMDFATQTTIGANGAASALTANPVGYIIIDISGTERIIPFYTK